MVQYRSRTGRVPTRVKHSPGKGLVVGLCGIAALLLSYFALPWISEGGEDITFTDIRDAFHEDESPTSTRDPDVQVAASGVGDVGDAGSRDPQSSATTPVDPTAPQPTEPGGTSFNTVVPPLPYPGTPAVPSDSASTTSYDRNAEELDAYTDWGWTTVLYFSITAVAFAAWVVPANRVSRLVTGTLTFPCLGWLNLLDRDGSTAPRVLSTLAAAFVVLEVIGNAYNLFWDKAGSPDPAIGAWLGVAGSIAILASCILGTNRHSVPEYG